MNEGGKHNDTWFTKKKAYLKAIKVFMNEQHRHYDMERRPEIYYTGEKVVRVQKFSTIEEPVLREDIPKVNEDDDTEL